MFVYVEERLRPEDLEILRRSLAMSPSLPRAQAERLLADVRRLRAKLKSVDDDLADIEHLVQRTRRDLAEL
jgi:hypothetical protein